MSIKSVRLPAFRITLLLHLYSIHFCPIFLVCDNATTPHTFQYYPPSWLGKNYHCHLIPTNQITNLGAQKPNNLYDVMHPNSIIVLRYSTKLLLFCRKSAIFRSWPTICIGHAIISTRYWIIWVVLLKPRKRSFLVATPFRMCTMIG